MIVHRFCSSKEHLAVLFGERLENFTNHALMGRASSAIGFCFFTEDPDDAKHWLSGIVDMDWLMTYEVDQNCLLPARAQYAEWSADGEQKGLIMRNEWCSCEISPDKFKLISATDRFAGYAPKIPSEVLELLRLFF